MDFYYFNGSPPCHSVMMAAKAVGVEMNYKEFDYAAGSHLKPEFLKINPQHSLPTIVDDGFPLWESRAIMMYLAEKYDKTDLLYPTCPNKRGLINQRLYFDMGLYQKFADYYYPQVMAKAPANPEIFKKMEDTMVFLDTFLDGQKYAAGDNLTIADIALATTIFCFDAAKFDLSKYPNVQKWYKYVITVIPGYELAEKGRADFKTYFVNL